MDEIYVADIKRTDTIKLSVKIKPWKGKTYVDIREQFFSKKTNEWVHTKKGITVSASILSDLINALEQAEAKLITNK